jgi:hypothetical protein
MGNTENCVETLLDAVFTTITKKIKWTVKGNNLGRKSKKQKKKQAKYGKIYEHI